MVELTAAWEVLGDPVKRKLYDQQRARPQDPAIASQWAEAHQEATTAAQHYPP